MSAVKRSLALLAALAFVVSLGVHSSTYVAPGLLLGQTWPWLLHFGVFVVLVPVVILQRRGRRDGSGGMLDGAPGWMRATCIAAFAYALVNFAVFLFFARDGGPHAQADGTFALLDHGRFVREITEAEYVVAVARVRRGFSGHWMALYALAMTALEASARRSESRH